MPPLDRALRSRLEQTIREARRVAESAARAALSQLGVARPAAEPFLTEAQGKLRRRLRAHGRQLGDALNGAKPQTMERLVEETAYEHWQRMLFARFLAENGLLMYPDPDEPVAVTLAECAELAAEEGRDPWELAASYAAALLPQIFRLDSPVFAISLAPEDQQKLEALVTGLPREVFTAQDSLGWVYQFWQADAKDRINKSEVKIGADELAAVTQLFTEPYMVDFLLDNTLGAWHAMRTLSESDLRSAQSEAELREKAALPNLPLTCLRFIREDGRWRPAGGVFKSWPENLAEFRLIDPCCGSGHFLCAALRMLSILRMHNENLAPKEAISRVLAENLHGLELDERCVKLAAFALAFTAWTWQPEAGSGQLGWFALPRLNIACSGLAPGGDKGAWISLAPGHSRLRNALELLYGEFANAPSLGSLIAPNESYLAPESWQLEAAVRTALASEALDVDALAETAVAARGIAAAAGMLGQKYQLVCTNVPYLARGKQAESIRKFCEEHYPEAKGDLATVFLERGLRLCVTGGACALVLPQNWLFLTSYTKLREKLLKSETWDLLARLGAKGFQTPMWDFNVQLFIISHLKPPQATPLAGENARPHLLAGLDVSGQPNAQAKTQALPEAVIETAPQTAMLANPDARVAFGETGDTKLLSDYADALVGLQTSDDQFFTVFFWELPIKDAQVWEYLQITPELFHEYTGRNMLVRWEKGKGILLSLASSRPTQGLKAIGKQGIAIHRMRALYPYHYASERFHQNIAVIVPHDPSHLPAIWCYCSSPDYNNAVREIDQSLKVTNATLVKVPFDLPRWQKVAAERYPNGLPKPYSDDPTQWIFHGHPCGSVIWEESAKTTAKGPLRQDASVLHVAVARLLGYRWPCEKDSGMELAPEQREWAKACGDLAQFADRDGIVALPALAGEEPASERLYGLLEAAYGESWSNDILARLLADAGHAGKTLESWLRESFFSQHCQLFMQRPFIWQIWDGLADGFSVLLNYHRLDYRNLEKLIYTYLGDWISRQRQAVAAKIDGSQEKLAAAGNLKQRLELILSGEHPHDIFVRWKTLARQPIGWNPDLNDGVRLNIRPFMQAPDIGKKSSGLLRGQPNIKWGKDRGRDPEAAPWFAQFQGERINDWHLSLKEKMEARKDG